MSEENSVAVESAPAEAVETSAVESNETVEAGSEESGSVESGSVQANTEAELAAEVEQAIEDGASEEEVKQMIREFEVKVNGKTYKRQIDLNDEEALKKELQMALAGRQAMQKSAELEKAYKQDYERLKNDPFELLKEMGLDPLKLSSSYIEQYLESQKKSPEEIAREEQAREFAAIKEERDRLIKEKEEIERQKHLSQIENEIQDDIISALESDNELPTNPKVIDMIIDNMIYAMDNGWTDVTAKDVIPNVKNQLQSSLREIVSSLKSEDALKTFIGEDTFNKFRDDRVKKMKEQVTNVNSIKEVAKKPSEKDAKPKKKIKLSDFMGGR